MAWVYNPFTGKLDQAGTSGGSGNPFNQNLNTTDSPSFYGLAVGVGASTFGGDVTVSGDLSGGYINATYDIGAATITASGDIIAAGTIQASGNVTAANIGTAAAKSVPATGNATTTQVVLGSDTRLTDSRTPTTHTHPLSALTQSSATNGQVPQWNGTSWVATTPSSGPSTTDALTEGSTNLYFTSARAISAVTWSTLTGKPTFATVATSASAADLSTGTLPDARLSTNVLLLTGAQTITGTKTLTPAANSSALIASGYSLTGANAQSLIDLAGTWNTTGTPTALKLNITDTASNSSSILMDLQVGGTSKFRVYKNSAVICDFIGSETATRTAITSSGGIGARFGYNQTAVIASNDLQFGSANDVIINRDAANTLALRNGTNVQKLSVYSTYTSGTSYRRIALLTASDRVSVVSEAQTSSVLPLEFSVFTGSAPTSSTLTAGCFSVVNVSGTVRLYANNGGTIVSVALA